MKTSLLRIYKDFENAASGLDNFIIGQKEDVPYDITELANGYCDAYDRGDAVKKNQYMSALMIRYWHMVVVLYEQSKSTKLSIEEMVGWVYEGIEKACEYRSWLDSTKEISNDPKGAEKCINQCITSIRGHYYQRFNSDVRKIHYLPAGLDSLDVPIFESEGTVINKIDTLIGDEGNYGRDMSDDIIQSLLDKNKIVEALIVDGIAHHDSFSYSVTEEVKDEVDENGDPVIVNHYATEFNARKLVKHLLNLNSYFIKQFMESYNVSEEILLQAIAKIATYRGTQLHRIVEHTLDVLKYNKEVQSALCQ